MSLRFSEFVSSSSSPLDPPSPDNPPLPGRLLLSPATLKGNGRCSSVCTFSSGSDGKRVIVSVRDVSFSRSLYYTLGVIEEDGATVSWCKTTYYGDGGHPSVCVVVRGGEYYAIECHSSHFGKMCSYQVGKIKLPNDKMEGSIEWSKAECIGDKDRAHLAGEYAGKKPKIAANNGTIIVIMEELCSLNKLKYYIADSSRFITPASGENTIKWKRGDDKDFFRGLEPNISINIRDEVAAVCRSYNRKVSIKLGKLSKRDNICSIKWNKDTIKLPSFGINPTICFNSEHRIVVICENFWKLCITSGRETVKGKEIQWDTVKDSDKSVLQYGAYPSVDLSDDGVVLEMHSIPYGLNLYYSLGKINVCPSEQY